MQQAIIQEEVINEPDPIEIKDMKKADRMLRSEAARHRRKELKMVREMKVVNEWAKARRARKK